MTREIIENYRKIILPFMKKKLLEINYENQGESDADEFEKDFNEILDLAAKALEQEPRWIPVSERMPNFNDIVLASTDSNYDELKVIITVCGGEAFWFNGRIKAWMPLPAPYKAERSDKE